MLEEDGHRPTLDPEERGRIERSNQIFLRLRKELHDREKQPTEKDVRDAAQGARWLREVVEHYSESLAIAYEDALAASGLPEDDRADLWKASEEAGGFSSFVKHHLRRLEEATPEHPNVAHQDLMCATVAGLLAGGTMMGNSFYFGFAIGASRKASCW